MYQMMDRFFMLLLALLLLSPGILKAEEPENAEMVQEQASLQELTQFVNSNLASEENNITRLNEELRNIKEKGSSLKTELNAYRIQLSTYGNLLVLPGVEVQDLEKAQVSSQTSLKNIEALLTRLTPKLNNATLLLQQTREQQTLNENHLSQIKGQPLRDEYAEELFKKLKNITSLLISKEKLLHELIKGYTEESEEAQDVGKALNSLVERLDSEIRIKKKEELFKRKELPLISAQWPEIAAELIKLKERAQKMQTRNFWITELMPAFKDGAYLRIVAVSILFLIIFKILVRLRRYCEHLKQAHSCRDYPWRLLTVQLLQRSLLLLGFTVFLMSYMQLRHLDSISLFRKGLDILWMLLLTKWVLDFPVLFNQTMGLQIPSPLVFRMRLLTQLVRIFSLMYMSFEWFVPGTGMVLFIFRALFEILSIVWMISFVHYLNPALEKSFLRSRHDFVFLRSTLLSGIYITVAGGPLLELAGYGTLAYYWFLSWGRTAVVGLWATLFFFILREWSQKINAPSGSPSPENHFHRSQTLQWLVFKICWLAWLAAVCLGILFSWGASQTVIVNIIDIFRYPIPLGAVTLSLTGCLSASLVLFFTQVAARLWRHTLHKKILPQSGIEIGLQESIITITTYILWSIGILTALYAFGLNMTSITVAFGALGIGLGFGLQNIFNNFISGIILLFERPIQVGDDVEINGIWARVKTINVRSTIVQTYDNASLIIPNSDFISSQVTNWSFKDKTIRRQITVGVAYGSNVELVRDSLLEIAANTPMVFKFPKPEVLFTDFGDSALIFKLRLWTDVDHMLTVDTQIRFGIDRIFRDRNITIPFPQSDVHLFHENREALPIDPVQDKIVNPQVVKTAQEKNNP